MVRVMKMNNEMQIKEKEKALAQGASEWVPQNHDLNSSAFLMPLPQPQALPSLNIGLVPSSLHTP